MGKTKRVTKGRAKGPAKEAHYGNDDQNRRDGIDQANRRARVIEEDIERPPEPTRVKKGDDRKFLGEEEARNEKFPGCPILIRVDVGEHGGRENWSSGQIVSEGRFNQRLSALHRHAYYERPRSDERNTSNKEHPGLFRNTITTYPPYDRSLKAAVQAGAFKPIDFQAWLAESAWLMRRVWKKATCLRGAKEGIDMELLIAHLIQGVLHLHPYSRDCHLATHERMGLFKTESAKKRLVLACLGPGELAAWRHKKFGLLPVPQFVKLKDKNKKGFIVEGWELLEARLRDRRRRMGYTEEDDEKCLAEKKPLPRPPDVILSDFWDDRIAELRIKRPELEPFFLAEEEVERAKNRAEVAQARSDFGLTARDEADQKVRAATELREKAEAAARLAREEEERHAAARYAAERKQMEAEVTAREERKARTLSETVARAALPMVGSGFVPFLRDCFRRVVGRLTLDSATKASYFIDPSSVPQAGRQSPPTGIEHVGGLWLKPEVKDMLSQMADSPTMSAEHSDAIHQVLREAAFMEEPRVSMDDLRRADKALADLLTVDAERLWVLLPNVDGQRAVAQARKEAELLGPLIDAEKLPINDDRYVVIFSIEATYREVQARAEGLRLVLIKQRRERVMVAADTTGKTVLFELPKTPAAESKGQGKALPGP